MKGKFEKIKNQLKANFANSVKMGANDYNLFSILRKDNEEAGLHSAFIFSLLDTDGEHYQKDLFLKLFLCAIGYDNFFDDTKNIIVKKEYVASDDARYDIFIEENNKCIVLENKIDTNDNKGDNEKSGQIDKYIDNLSKDKKEFLLLYLTPNADKPKNTTKYDFSNDNKILDKNENEIGKYGLISYDKEIRNWIELCLAKVNNLENLAIYLKAYLEVIDKILGRYRSVMAMKIDNLLVNYENYKFLSEMEKYFKNGYFEKRKKEILNKFLEKIKENFEIDNPNLKFKILNEKERKEEECLFEITNDNIENFFLQLDYQAQRNNVSFGIATKEKFETQNIKKDFKNLNSFKFYKDETYIYKEICNKNLIEYILEFDKDNLENSINLASEKFYNEIDNNFKILEPILEEFNNNPNRYLIETTQKDHK